jgi:hypothetical protein
MPYGIGVYIRDQADRCAASYASLSDKQKTVAQSGAERAADENMESFRAMQSDVMHTGADAFSIAQRRSAPQTGRPDKPPLQRS